MDSKFIELVVEIVRFVDDTQPGAVACEFVDAAGCRHTIIDKVPMFTVESLDAESQYPQPGVVRCVVLNRWLDATGRQVVRISTADPDVIESSEDLSEFVVLATQLAAPGHAA